MIQLAEIAMFDLISIWRNLPRKYGLLKIRLPIIALALIPFFLLLQLPFALIPVLHFTGDQTIMKSFKNGRLVTVKIVFCATLISRQNVL